MISSNSEEDDQQFSGLELDELDIPSTPENTQKEDPKSIRREYRRKNWLLLCIAIGLCLLVGVGYLYIRLNQEETPQFNEELGNPKDQLLIFPSFVIPFKGNKQFTYISFSISFYVPNKELKREVMEKKVQLRGIIYDILREEIHKLKEIPSLEKLKEFVMRGVNHALFTGKVNEIYITKFLVV